MAKCVILKLTVRCQRASAIDVPLIKHLLLDHRISTKEVIERLGIRLRPENTECPTLLSAFPMHLHYNNRSQIVVLEVQTHAWKVNKWFNTCRTKCLGVTYE
jgi:hypothetical protein